MPSEGESSKQSLCQQQMITLMQILKRIFELCPRPQKKGRSSVFDIRFCNLDSTLAINHVFPRATDNEQVSMQSHGVRSTPKFVRGRKQ